MGKTRIYELAKVMNIKSTVIIDKLKELGFIANNHMVSLDPQTVSMLKEAFELEKAEQKKEKEPGPASKEKSTAERKAKASAEYAQAGKKSKRKKRKGRGDVEPADDVMIEEEEEKAGEEGEIYLDEALTVKEFAEIIKESPAGILKELIKKGIPANINYVLDFDIAKNIASEYGYEAFRKSEQAESAACSGEAPKGALLPRPPVVTIMGHVDHGKTSLLDFIRKSSIVQGEKGGITQHIGAYYVPVGDKKIAFLDTPGHEAFTSMRARGAQATDIVVLVVAGDEGVKPQTIEAINHSKAANVPIIVAVNKMDKAGANIDSVKKELSNYGVLPEEWGGDNIFVPVVAITGEGIDELLEMILLQSEMMELKAIADAPAKGIVVESKMDPKRGPVATVLVQEGTLHIGDPFVAGVNCGRVKAMTGSRGERYDCVGPSIPVEILGFSGVCQPGDTFTVVESEKLSKNIADQRCSKLREASFKKPVRISLESLFDEINKGKLKYLNIVLKCDVQGSVQAIQDSLKKLSTEKVEINIISTGVGPITENDIILAQASDAVVVGFNNRMDINARKAAEREGVSVQIYNIIYELINEVRAAMSGLLEPIIEKVYQGTTEIRKIYKLPKIGKIAGCYVLDGKITRNSLVKILRENIQIYEGRLSSLKRFKDDAKEVVQGYECGLAIESFQDIKEGDIIESYDTIEKKQEL